MAKCEICDDFNEDHIDNEGDDSLYESEQYKPNLYFYWHGDIEEDYDMGEYECICVSCFNGLDLQGEIKWKKVKKDID
tara:strand:+ start:1316 stop:1549 length:234 start_codon:yes stop_codon:yes gene_type:complete